MNLDLDDAEARALLNLLIDAVEDDRYPLSPRVRVLKDILMKFGEIGGLDPELARQAAPLCIARTSATAAAEGLRAAEQGQISQAMRRPRKLAQAAGYFQKRGSRCRVEHDCRRVRRLKPVNGAAGGPPLPRSP